jgi:hypothetical protein
MTYTLHPAPYMPYIYIQDIHPTGPTCIYRSYTIHPTGPTCIYRSYTLHHTPYIEDVQCRRAYTLHPI